MDFFLQAKKLQEFVWLLRERVKMGISICETTRKWEDAKKSLSEARNFPSIVANIFKNNKGSPVAEVHIMNCIIKIRARAEVMRRKKAVQALKKNLIEQESQLTRLGCEAADAYYIASETISYVNDLKNSLNHQIV